MSEDLNHSEEVSSHLPSRGALMRSAREKAGLTVAQLATGMNLSQRQILALEADDLTALPSATFVRGFVRNYARIVGCDPAEFESEEYTRTERKDSPAITLAPPADHMPIESNRSSANRRWLIAAGVALIVGLIGGYVRLEHVEQARDLIVKQSENLSPVATPNLAREDQPAVTSSSEAASHASSAAPSASPVASNPIAETPGTASSVRTTPAVSSAVGSSAAVTSSLASSTASAIPSPAVVIPPKVGSADATADINASPAPQRLDPNLPAYPVVLDLQQDSWVDLREIGGKVFIHGLVKAGEHRQYQARGQVKVVIGNASTASLSWKGKAVDLTESTKESVAK